MTRPLWEPTRERVEASALAAFMRRVAVERGAPLADYASLHRWSVEEPERFWRAVWEFSGVIAEAAGDVGVERPGEMPGARFFPGAKLNFAANLLRRGDDADAIVFRGEDRVRRRLSHAELRERVVRLRRALEASGVAPGDRIAGFLPNLPETVVAMLAATSLGAIWTSCSPDFGVEGVVDRFGQIEPKILFAADGYFYSGKTIDSLERVAAVRARVPSIERVVIVPYVNSRPDLDALPGAVLLEDYVEGHSGGEIDFPSFPFDHPLYVLYTSGTTGKPKCIVHGAGGTLLQHLKEHRLHCDVRSGDRVFYYTTCGWMMWNWLVSALASEATILLYDGSPMWPDGNALFDYAAAERMTLFGTSARFLAACEKAGLAPRQTHDLGSLRTVTSTGSPLLPEGFDYVYRKIKEDVCLSSISGGTDIVSCFVGGNPIDPVWRGEIQAAGLGMSVEVFDPEGRPLESGAGELVCTRPFPSMPVGFWNDPDGGRYRAAYFERFPGVWCHGDWAERTEHGGFVIHGRSDAVLNPGGVRIGTAEIYAQVEAIEEVLECVAVGQRFRGDVRIVLFVRLRPGIALDEALERRIRERLRANASPRHVPAKILEVADIPRTRSGKIVELAVRDVIEGRPVKNREALANPEALDRFRDRPELRD